MSSEVKSISTLDVQVNNQAREEEVFEDLKREDKGILTTVGNVQYDVCLSRKVTVQYQTS